MIWSLRSHSIPVKCQMRVKSRPLFFIKASNVETSWLKRCWLHLMEADVQTFQQLLSSPHHLHSFAFLHSNHPFEGHNTAFRVLAAGLQPGNFCSELAEASTCSEWSWMVASWWECLSAIAGWDGQSSIICVPRFSKGLLWTMDRGWPWMVPWYIWYSWMQTVACCEY